MEILITLCARGGSKGIPGKNIKYLDGKPVLEYSLNHAKEFSKSFGADITLSTDSLEIKQVAKELGLITKYSRPASLSLDSAGKVDTIKHVLVWEEQVKSKKYDLVLDLDISSPMRNMQDLELAYNLLMKDPHALNLFSVNNSARNPYFNMVEKKDNGYYGLVKQGDFLTRQSAPNVYDLNASFYFFRRIFFEPFSPKVVNERSLIYIMPHICFDLDHIIDFEFMEYLIINNKLGFKL